MITDILGPAQEATNNGHSPQAAIEGQTWQRDEISVPSFLERKYNLEILRRRSVWPALPPAKRVSTLNGSFDTAPLPIRRSAGPNTSGGWRIIVVPAFGAMLAAGIVLILAGLGMLPLSNGSGQNGIGTNVASPTPTVPATPTAIATAKMPAIIAPSEPTSEPTVEVSATPTEVPPTATPEETPTPAVMPTDTPLPTIPPPPTRPAPPRPTNTAIPPPVAEPTVTKEPIPTEEPPTATSEATNTQEPTPTIFTGPTEVPTPLPGILTPTPEEPSPTIPGGPTVPPTPLPGILTPTPEVLPGILP
jgi:hypothetical protein